MTADDEVLLAEVKALNRAVEALNLRAWARQEGTMECSLRSWVWSFPGDYSSDSLEPRTYLLWHLMGKNVSPATLWFRSSAERMVALVEGMER